MVSGYASVRPRLPNSAFAVAAVAGGAIASSGILNIRIQACNRAGRNLLSESRTVSYSPGQKIVVSLNADARKPAEDLWAIWISGEKTGNPAHAKRLAVWEAKESGTDRPLPANVELTTDAQLAGTLSTDIADTRDTGGCDSSSVLYAPTAYRGDNSPSVPIAMWFSNGLTESAGTVIQAGTQLNINVLLNGQSSFIDSYGRLVAYASLFSGKILTSFLGIVRRSTGEWVAGVAPEGAKPWYQDSAPLILKANLPPGYAAAYSLQWKFNKNQLPADVLRSVIALSLEEGSKLGYPLPPGFITEDVVLAVGDRLRIIPELGGLFRRLGGMMIGGGMDAKYQTPLVGEQVFGGLASNLAGQKLCINAALAGDMMARLPTNAPLVGESLRAIASTVGGVANLTVTSPFVVTQGQGISLTVTLPINPSNGRGIIRSDYPDVIRGQEAAFNASRLAVFVRRGAQIWQIPSVNLLPNSLGVQVNITNLTNAIAVPAFPTAPADFSLFAPSQITHSTTSGGGLDAGIYEIGVGFEYGGADNLEITALSHDMALGCVQELAGSLFTPGVPGHRIWLFDSIPDPSVGAVGDLGINKLTSEYHRKVSGAWTLQGSLRGVQGTAGAKIWLLNNEPPETTLGAVGDLAINSTNSNYYGKNSDGWVLIGSLQGLKGDPGTLGVEGSKTITLPALLPSVPVVVPLAGVGQVVLLTGLTTNISLRVRGYATQASANADIMRPITQRGSKASGLIFDLITGSGVAADGATVTNQFNWIFAPPPTAINLENPRTSDLAIAVTNLTSADADAVVTFTYYTLKT